MNFINLSSQHRVTYCYATGNVSVIGKGSSNIINAGGFAGFATNISDCYATGNVFVDASRGGAIGVGGLAGFNQYGSINRSFASGNVTVQKSSNNGNTHVAGLVGTVWTSTDAPNAKVTNSASLSASVTATGPLPTGTSTKSIGRVFGSSTTTANANNHGYIDMELRTSPRYGSMNDPGAVSVYGESNAAGKDGLDARLGIFRDRDFWKTILLFNDTNWIFTTVEERGYPILRGHPLPDGKENTYPLGGQ